MLLKALVATEWKKEVTKEKPSLVRSLFRAFFPKYAWLGGILIGETIIRIIQAALLGYFVDIIVNGGSSNFAILNDGLRIANLS